MARSVALELTSRVPWLKSGAMSATIVPSPICLGLAPPEFSVGADPKLIVCMN